MRIRTVGFIFIIGLFLVQAVWAGGFQFRKYAGEFMDIGVDARAQGMGGAFTAISGDVTSVYYNPSGIFSLKGQQISFMHTQQMISSVNYDFLAYGRPQGENRVFAFSLIRLGVDNIKDSRKAIIYAQNNPDEWRIDWDKITSFNASDYIFTFSMAQQWKRGWVWGGSLRFIRRNLAEHHANGLGMDVGVQKRFRENLWFGANLRNATTTLVAWDTGEKELVKPALYLGGAYLLQINRINSEFLPVADVILRAENRRESALSHLGAFSADVAVGMEYRYRRVLFLRSGMDEIQRLNLGVGIQIPHIRIDYAFTKYDTELGNSHRIGLIIIL